MSAHVVVRVSLHRAEMAAALRNPSGPPARFVEQSCQRVESYAKVFCPVDEGRLRNSIGHHVRVEGAAVVGSVGSDLEYAKYVHEGTGIYGPRRQWIYPKRGNVLVFETKGPAGPMQRGQSGAARGSRQVVFARRVRGMPGSPFLVRGLEAGMAGVPIRRFT